MLNNNNDFLIEGDSFTKSENELLKYFINHRYLPNFINDTPNTEWIESAPIELIIRPECNQHCEYCYIAKYGDELYPKEERADKETILNNIKIILSTLLEKKIFTERFSLFAGEMVSDGILFDIFELFYDYVQKLKLKLDEDNSPLKDVAIKVEVPINSKSLLKNNMLDKYKEYINKYLSINLNLVPSISTDGLYATEYREKEFKITQEDFDRLLDFASDVQAGFHPMVSPENVHLWKEKNFDWWVEAYKKHGRADHCYPMMLQVRNDGWTQDRINDYLDLLDKMWETRKELCNNDIEKLTDYIAGRNDDCLSECFDPVTALINSGDPFILQCATCGLQSHLYINTANLKILHCHRNAYPQFTAGKFLNNGSMITGVEAAPGFSTWINLQINDPMMNPFCESCEYRYVCMKGCMGAQYEYSGQITLPIPSLCNLFTAIYDKLAKLYYKSGVYDIALKKGYLDRNLLLAQFIYNHGKNTEDCNE